jgi:hypothetical protein
MQKNRKPSLAVNEDITEKTGQSLGDYPFLALACVRRGQWTRHEICNWDGCDRRRFIPVMIHEPPFENKIWITIIPQPMIVKAFFAAKNRSADRNAAEEGGAAALIFAMPLSKLTNLVSCADAPLPAHFEAHPLTSATHPFVRCVPHRAFASHSFGVLSPRYHPPPLLVATLARLQPDTHLRIFRAYPRTSDTTFASALRSDIRSTGDTVLGMFFCPRSADGKADAASFATNALNAEQEIVECDGRLNSISCCSAEPWG